MRPKQRRWTDKDLADIAREQARNNPPFGGIVLAAPVAKRKMNRTESRYAQQLEWQQRAGEIAWYKYEGMKLKLADRTYLTPDFCVVMPDGKLEFREVKAGVMEDDAAVKLKVAAAMFPFRFIVAWSRDGGGFVLKDVAEGL